MEDVVDVEVVVEEVEEGAASSLTIFCIIFPFIIIPHGLILFKCEESMILLEIH